MRFMLQFHSPLLLFTFMLRVAEDLLLLFLLCKWSGMMLIAYFAHDVLMHIKTPYGQVNKKCIFQ